MSRVIVLAGRRIDAPGAPARFPLRNRDLVCARIADLLRQRGAAVVVASGACGADLLAHQAARALGIRSALVLPFERDRFRAASVEDRPGEWRDVFEDVLSAVRPEDQRVLDLAAADEAAYQATNRELVERAIALSGEPPDPAEVLAVAVWEGAPRGPDDLTEHFLRWATARGLATTAISTR